MYSVAITKNALILGAIFYIENRNSLSFNGVCPSKKDFISLAKLSQVMKGDWGNLSATRFFLYCLPGSLHLNYQLAKLYSHFNFYPREIVPHFILSYKHDFCCLSHPLACLASAVSDLKLDQCRLIAMQLPHMCHP